MFGLIIETQTGLGEMIRLGSSSASSYSSGATVQPN